MIRLEPVGAEAVLLVLADTPDDHLPLRIARLAEAIRQRLGPQLRELVPGWTTLLLHYDLLQTDPARLAADLAPLLEQWPSAPSPDEQGRLHRLPVWYGGEDLGAVAEACGLCPGQVIDLHCAVEYRVGAIGFAPALPTWADSTPGSPCRAGPPHAPRFLPAAWPSPNGRRPFIHRPPRVAGTCWACARSACSTPLRRRLARWRWVIGCASSPSTRPPTAASA